MGLDVNSKPVLAFRRVITFLLVCFAWSFFRANNTGELLVLLSKLFTDFGATSVISDMGFTLSSVLILVLSFVLLSMIDKRYTYGRYDNPTGEKIGVDAATFMVWAVIFAWILILGGDATSSIASGGASALIYFQF